MRKIFYILAFAFTIGMFAQAPIETDPLYLQYEAEYLNHGDRNKYGQEYEQAVNEFYLKFSNDQKIIETLLPTYNKKEGTPLIIYCKFK